MVAANPDRFGFFATVPMPHVEQAAIEAVRALDELHAASRQVMRTVARMISTT